ncbi:MAG: citrate synthase/methylcitrate synthase [Chloroflexota bacterium]
MAGLEGTIAAQTRLSKIDGQRGELIIGGFPLAEIASQASFEETLYLLWHDRLPNKDKLASFQGQLAKHRILSETTKTLIKQAASQQAHPMDILRMATDTLSLGLTKTDSQEQSLAIIGAFPTIVAHYWRCRNGETPIEPHPELGHAANYLYMLSGQVPSSERVRGLETYLNTVVDHGLNASTFAARVIIATQSDMVSAIVGAIGALKGPRHGGAPAPALDMVFEIGEKKNAESVLRAKLDRRELLMGFGHRVYKVRDPRAEVLAQAAKQFYQTDGDTALYELATYVENLAVTLLAEYKPDKRLQTNVEFYTALLLHGLGLPKELFTPTFALARVGGWTAHCFEQDRLIRPLAAYIGDTDRQWTPIEARSLA